MDEIGLISKLAGSLGISPGLVLYLLCIVGGIPTAALIRCFPPGTARHLWSIFAGSLLALAAFSGVEACATIWAFSLVTYALMLCLPRATCGYIVFATSFTFLTLCHVFSAGADSWRKGGVDHTGTLMILTLKLVSVAMDYQDGASPSASKRALVARPSLLEFLSFALFPGSLMAGPVLFLADYADFVNDRGLWKRPRGPLAQTLPGLSHVLSGYQTAVAATASTASSFLASSPRLASLPSLPSFVSVPVRWLVDSLDSDSGSEASDAEEDEAGDEGEEGDEAETSGGVTGARLRRKSGMMLLLPSLLKRRSKSRDSEPPVSSRGSSPSSSVADTPRMQAAIEAQPANPLDLASQSLDASHLSNNNLGQDLKPVAVADGAYEEQEPLLSCMVPLLRALAKAFLCLGVHLLLGFAPVGRDFLLGDQLLQRSLAVRLLLVCAASAHLRASYYFGWSMAEAAMVASGLGFSGWTQDSHGRKTASWRRGTACEVWQVEAEASLAQKFNFWNMSVGGWLRAYVYDRLTPLWGASSIWALVATQVVSAFWHGLHPGYYFFFLNAALLQHASRAVYRCTKDVQISSTLQRVYTCLRIGVEQALLGYLIFPFVVLRADTTLRVWASLWLFGTIVPLALPFLLKTQGKGLKHRVQKVE